MELMKYLTSNILNITVCEWKPSFVLIFYFICQIPSAGSFIHCFEKFKFRINSLLCFNKNLDFYNKIETTF